MEAMTWKLSERRMGHGLRYIGEREPPLFRKRKRVQREDVATPAGRRREPQPVSAPLAEVTPYNALDGLADRIDSLAMPSSSTLNMLYPRAPEAPSTPSEAVRPPTTTQGGIELDTEPSSLGPQSLFFTGAAPTIQPSVASLGTAVPVVTISPTASVRSTPQSSSTAMPSSSSMSSGQMVGVIAGSIAGAILIFTLIFCFATLWRRKHRPTMVTGNLGHKDSYRSLGSGPSTYRSEDVSSDGSSEKSSRLTINTTATRPRYNKHYLPPVPEEGSPATQSPTRPPPLHIAPYSSSAADVGNQPPGTALLPSPRNHFGNMRIPFLSSNRNSTQSSIYSIDSFDGPRRGSSTHPAYRKWRDSLWSVAASSHGDSRTQNGHSRTVSSENPAGYRRGSSTVEFKSRLSSVDAYSRLETEARAGVGLADEAQGGEEELRSCAIPVAHITNRYSDIPPNRKNSKGRLTFAKLATSSDSAKWFMRFISHSSALEAAKPVEHPRKRKSPERMPVADPSPMLAHIPAVGEGRSVQAGPLECVSGPMESASSRSRPANAARTGANGSSRSLESNVSAVRTVQGEKPVASGNGVSVSISLAEPVIYLSGFEQHDPSSRSTAILRGSLLLSVSKSAKIKSISIKFKGRAETEWPEGIPPKRTDFKDINKIIEHTWSFYDCNMGSSQHHGAHSFQPARGLGSTVTEPDSQCVTSSSFDHFLRPYPRTDNTIPRDTRRLSWQAENPRSFGTGESAAANPAHKGYRTFTPGDYIYNFELPIDSRYPETVDVDLGSVRYELEATVERAGAFRANLIGSKEVPVIRVPSGDSLESIEPIAISRDWEDQLHYDIVISGKSFPLGAQVPIAFKLTPLAKVQCHRIKVYITENVQYFTKDKKVHRIEPTRKVQLFEKRADGASTSTFPGSSMRIISGGGVAYDDRDRAAAGEEDVQRDTMSLLGHLEGEHNVGPTEMELNVQLPGCHTMSEKDKSQRIHFDTTYGNIQVHHWIKIVMRLSKSDPENPGKRRHFEISIDSPFNILSCLATQAHTALPAYSPPEASSETVDEVMCGCPGLSRTRKATSASSQAANVLASTPLTDSVSLSTSASPGSSSLNVTAPRIAAPPTAHVHDASSTISRPIHLLRAPSFNPPPFSDDDPPPPLVTPPPKYESLVDGDPRSGLADYFARLADEIDEADDGAHWATGMEIPLTPGGRVNRSMDEVRGWAPVH